MKYNEIMRSSSGNRYIEMQNTYPPLQLQGETARPAARATSSCLKQESIWLARSETWTRLISEQYRHWTRLPFHCQLPNISVNVIFPPPSGSSKRPPSRQVVHTKKRLECERIAYELQGTEFVLKSVNTTKTPCARVQGTLPIITCSDAIQKTALGLHRSVCSHQALHTIKRFRHVVS
jgi:hypothetical protein